MYIFFYIVSKQLDDAETCEILMLPSDLPIS